MWHDCTRGTLQSCAARRPYLPPGVSGGTNRYAFLLLKQPAQELDRASLPSRWPGSRAPKEGVGYYDLARLIKHNDLEPLAWNFMHVTGNGKPASQRRSATQRGRRNNRTH